MKKKVLIICMMIFFVNSSFSFYCSDISVIAYGENATVEDMERSDLNYYDFLLEYAKADKPAIDQYAELSDNPEDFFGTKILSELSDKNDVLLLNEDGSYAVWNMDVESAGLYLLDIEYLLMMDNTANAQFMVRINDEYQNISMESLYFPRRFRNTSEIRVDTKGNEVRPQKEEIKDWEEWHIDDFDVQTQEGMFFYLESGRNTIEIKVDMGGVAISTLRVFNKIDLMSYAEYLSENDKKANNSPNDFLWIKQAENCADTSDSVLYPTYDRSSVFTQPNDPAKLKLNTIGQSTWSQPGQWIEWEIQVPADGYYEIGMRVRQSELRGFFSTRAVYIDGNILFNELYEVNYPYQLGWYISTLGGEDNYLFYLEEGIHTIKMEATQGPVAESVAELEKLTLEMNNLYRNIIMVTGLNVDSLRDYMLEDQVPELIERLTYIRNRLEIQMDILASLGVKDGSDAVVIDKLIYQIDSFIEKPETIALRTNDFLSNIGSMSSWALSMRYQPLEIDYIYIKSPEVAEPLVGSGIIKQMIFRLQALFNSFVEDYSSLSSISGDIEAAESIKVWVALGRDQGQIIKDLSDNEFTPSTGIYVDLAIMQTGLNEAIAAGRAPDVVLYTGDVVNLASRGTLEDISKYDGFDDMKLRFAPNAFVPYTYNGNVYGVPLEQNILMLFYRTDVFNELELDPPSTWSEFDRVLTILQQNRLTAGLYAGTSTAGDTSIFELLLYQMGGSLFNDDLSAMILDSDLCYEAFKRWTDYYVEYSLLTEFNFYNRFRSGEMPIGIQGQSMYATLKLAAPELEGLWEMVPVPQLSDSDGNLSNVTIGSVTPALVLKNDNPDACFEYLDWFTSTENQVMYGQEVENILGLGARYNTANLEAIKNLNWTRSESNLLVSEINKVYITPLIPASYYVGRNLTNAFRKVIIRGYLPRESLLIYNEIVNNEITRKNAELMRRAMKSEQGEN